MLGLVAYQSSSEGEEDEENVTSVGKQSVSEATYRLRPFEATSDRIANLCMQNKAPPVTAAATDSSVWSASAARVEASQPQQPQSVPPPSTGALSDKPLVGPARPVDTSSPPPAGTLIDPDAQAGADADADASGGGDEEYDETPYQGLSPYAANRALIHDLTLPAVLNMDIPPSPPGSPDRGMEAVFKESISRAKSKDSNGGINAELASSREMRNPALLQNLMVEMGIIGDDEVEYDEGSLGAEAAQYATSLDRNIWDVTRLPPWGYKEELVATNAEIRRQLEREKKEKRARGERERPEFVPGSTGESGRLPGASTTTKGGIGVSLSEKIMEGVSRDERSSMVRRPISKEHDRQKGRPGSPRRR